MYDSHIANACSSVVNALQLPLPVKSRPPRPRADLTEARLDKPLSTAFHGGHSHGC